MNHEEREALETKRGEMGELVLHHTSIYLQCCDGQHEIRVKSNGGIFLVNHPDIPVAAMVQEYHMRRDGNKSDCWDFLWTLTKLEDEQPFEGDAVIRAFYKDNVEAARVLREALERRNVRRSREALHSAPRSVLSEGLRDKIFRDLSIAFPKKHVARGIMIALDGEPRVGGEKHALISLHIAKWARAYRRLDRSVIVKETKSTTTKCYFVVKIEKDISPTELYVLIYKRTSGARYCLAKAKVHMDYRGQWRIHKWLRQWPWERPEKPRKRLV